MSETPINVMMVGAGAVGGYFGVRLVKAGVSCSFLLRPRTLAAVKQKGLSVHSVDDSFTVFPVASDDPRHLPEAHLVILSVKRYDLDDVLNKLRPVLSPRTTLLTLQNGVDTERRIQELLPNVCIVGGVAYIYAKLAEPGVIEHYKKGTLAIGAWTSVADSVGGEASARQAPAGQGTFAKLGELRRQADPPPVRPQGPAGLAPSSIKALFDGAGIPCQLAEDIRIVKWEKMCWNVVFNPLTVLINDRVSKALSHPEMRAMIKLIVDEAVAVAKADGVTLGADMADKVVRWSQEIRDIHTSMFDDWKAGRRTEIDFLNGYLVRQGGRLGIPTPVNEAVCALIKTITESAPMGSSRLQIDGEVIQPVVFDAEALAHLPATEQIPDVSSVEPSMQGQGIRVRALLNVATGRIGADHVTLHSADGRFAVSLPFKQAAETGILIYRRDGRSLREDEGGPFRFIAPGLNDRCANVKGVTRIEFTIGPGADTRPPAKPA